MLHLDSSACHAKVLSPSLGITNQELSSVRASLKRHATDWLEERRGGMHRWSMDPYDRTVLARTREVAKSAMARGFSTILWLGIGGSALGPRVLQESFAEPDTPDCIVLDTIDPGVLAFYMATLDWRRTLVVAVSKSGNTLETMSALFLFWEKLRTARKLRANEAVIAVTDPEEGPLRTWAQQQGVALLPIHRDTGGRFSVFTPVGTLLLELIGRDAGAFLRGAKDMDTQCQNTSLEENPAAQLAATQFLLDTKRGCPVRVIMPYGDRLASVARWNQQLVAESLGKTEVHNPIPLAAQGTQDQHSLLQQWMAGPRKSWHLFVKVEEKPRVYVPDDLPEPFSHLAGKTFGQLLDACQDGTSRALTSVRRPHATITLTRLDEQHLGQLFFCFMAEVALLGKLYRIDPYGQPAVEVGKRITRDILSRGK